MPSCDFFYLMPYRVKIAEYQSLSKDCIMLGRTRTHILSFLSTGERPPINGGTRSMYNDWVSFAAFTANLICQGFGQLVQT